MARCGAVGDAPAAPVGGRAAGAGDADGLPEAPGCAGVSDKTHDVILKILAVLIGLDALVFMFGGLGEAGVF